MLRRYSHAGWLAALVLSIGTSCGYFILPRPPPTPVAAIMHPMDTGRVEIAGTLAADALMRNEVGGSGLAVHVGLPAGADLSLQGGPTWEGFSSGFQVAVPIAGPTLGSTPGRWQGWNHAFLIGSGFAYSTSQIGGTVCPAGRGPGRTCESKWSHLSVAPNLGYRTSLQWTPDAWFVFQLRLSYSQSLHLEGLAQFEDGNWYWLEPSVAIGWQPGHSAFRMAAGLNGYLFGLTKGGPPLPFLLPAVSMSLEF